MLADFQRGARPDDDAPTRASQPDRHVQDRLGLRGTPHHDGVKPRRRLFGNGFRTSTNHGDGAKLQLTDDRREERDASLSDSMRTSSRSGRTTAMGIPGIPAPEP